MLGHDAVKSFATVGLVAGCLVLIIGLGWESVAPLPGQEIAAAAGSAMGFEPVAVPTLGQWGLLMLALALMAVAFLVIRRRSSDRGRGQP